MTAPLEATLSLSPEVLEAISQRAAVIVLERLEEQSRAADDRWLTTREAAAHLGITVAALHKLTAARQIPFQQAGPSCKCWFRRADLDRWRAS